MSEESVGPGATGEEGNEFGEGAGDEGPRVSTPRERTRVVVVGVDGYLNGVEVAKDGVAALVGFEPGQTIALRSGVVPE